MGGNGPEDLKTKADILKFPEGFVCAGSQGRGDVDSSDTLQPAEHSKSSRLHLATFAVAHAYDHYGQMVEYLRMKAASQPGKVRVIARIAITATIAVIEENWTRRAGVQPISR